MFLEDRQRPIPRNHARGLRREERNLVKEEKDLVGEARGDLVIEENTPSAGLSRYGNQPRPRGIAIVNVMKNV